MSGTRSNANAMLERLERKLDRPLRVSRSQHNIGRTFLAVTFERVARHRRTEKHEIIKRGHAALCAKASNLVDPLIRGTMNLIQHLLWKCR